MRTIPQLAYDFIKGAEACRLTAYQDSRGIWTIGWGHTGPEVVEGLTITLAQALAYLITDVARAANRLAAAVRAEEISVLTDHEYGALVSFCFNLGADPKWNIWKLLNAGRVADVPAEMMRFDHAKINGVLTEVPGLMHRRMAECALWAAPDVATAVAIVQAAPVAAPPSSETREMATPPRPAGTAKASSQSKTLVTGCISACVAVGAPLVEAGKNGIKQVSDAVTPYVGDSTILQNLHSHLAIAGAALAVATVFFAWLKNHEAQTQ